MVKATQFLILSWIVLLSAPIQARSAEPPAQRRFATEIESIQKAIARIDSALYQLDTDGANASTRYAMEQLLSAKAELQKTSTALSKSN
jgi:hypothetical protein